MKNRVFDASEPVGGNEVLKFGAVESARSVLDQIIQDGASRMLQSALENEVEAFLERHSNKVDKEGIRQVVRNGYLPSRELVTGAGTLEIQQPRVRDKSPQADDRVGFSLASCCPIFVVPRRSTRSFHGFTSKGFPLAISRKLFNL